MRNCGITKTCAGVVAGARFITLKIGNHLEQNIGIIWHERSMLVNDNTVDYNASQAKKKDHETIYDGVIGIKENFLG